MGRQRRILYGPCYYFTLVTLLAVFATLRTLREKLFAAALIATVLVFGWFTIMTVLYNGIHQRLNSFTLYSSSRFYKRGRVPLPLFIFHNLYHLRFVFVLFTSQAPPITPASLPSVAIANFVLFTARESVLLEIALNWF